MVTAGLGAGAAAPRPVAALANIAAITRATVLQTMRDSTRVRRYCASNAQARPADATLGVNGLLGLGARQPADDAGFFHHRAKGRSNATLEEMACRFAQMPGPGFAQGIAHRYTGMHQNAGVAIAILDAGGATVAPVGDRVQIEHRTQRFMPGFAAPDLEIPVQIKIFASADAAD